MTKSKKIRNRIVIASAALCVIALLVAAAASIFSVSAAPVFSPETATTVFINSQNDLIKYAYEYNHGGHNENDILNIGLINGSNYNLTVIEPDYGAAFESIGTSTRPFNGKVFVPDNTIIKIISDTALFNYVTTNVEVVNSSNAVRELEFVRKSAGTDSPLFAAHVVNSAGSTADWKLTLLPDNVSDSTNPTTRSFAGVIGEIESGSKVKIEFTHASVNNSEVSHVSSANSVGTICGTLGDGAELEVICTTSTGFTYNVTSSGGNAGGLVGVMGDSSKLIFNESYLSYANVSSSNGNAGGIAGSATDAILEIDTANSKTVTVSNNISAGTNGCAGGIYGLYTCTKDNSGTTGGTRTFDLSDIYADTNLRITGGKDAGGVFGRLSATNNVTITDGSVSDVDADGVFNRHVQFSAGTNRGGVIGAYQNTDLAKTLEINNIKVAVGANGSSGGSTSGGAIGTVLKADGSSPVYIKSTGFRVSTSEKLSAGFIGSMYTKGSFLDMTGKFTASGNLNSGIVDDMNAGVLRLQGITNLYDATCSSAQIVRVRNNGLVYALGSGADSDSLTDGNWTLRRGQGNSDDIGDWGEVLRLKQSYNGMSENTFFTVDMTAHTVTMTGAVNPMTNTTDFIKTALNIQHNVTSSGGALRFTSGDGNKSATLLGSSLSISADIDLTNTGIIAMTRDDGTNADFTGTFSGGGHKVTLAIGETYGVCRDGSSQVIKTASDIGDNNWGTIRQSAGGHKYLGLFAKSNGATFNNLKIDGFISSRTAVSSYIGGITAEAAAASGSTLTLNTVDTAQLINLYTSGSGVYCGGAIGIIRSGSTGTFTVSSSTFENEIQEKRTSDTVYSYIGGAIGHDNSIAAHTVNFNTVSLAGTYDNTVSGSNKFKNVHYGGLISYITPKNDNTTIYGNVSRKLNISGVTVKNGVSITTKVNGDSARTIGAGAFLGNEWHDVDTTITNLIIGENTTGTPTIMVPSGSSADTGIGALVYKATGHMLVNGVTVNKATVTSAVNSSFGFVVNDAVNRSDDTNKSALYLELRSNNYNIAALDFSNDGTDVYDEIAAYSHFSDKSVDDNGNAVISIRLGTNGTSVTMNGTACNTYQNQTDYGQQDVTENEHARYYYNLDVIRAKASPSAAEKMLLWSLNKYAHATVRSNYFNNNYSNTISGNCDMVGLSYYPVDANGVTIAAGTTVKFYNNEIEIGESGTGNSDGVEHSTRADTKSQHYLMHYGIFRNYTGSLTVGSEGSLIAANGLTLKGNVGTDSTYSGFLICGMYGDQTVDNTANIRNVILDGARLYPYDGRALLVNDIGKNVHFNITGLKTADTNNKYSAMIDSENSYAASSLIGDAGYENAIGVYLTFKDIRLDARTSSGAVISSYGTKRSIFKDATLLNSFHYLNNSSGEYNYNYAEDWNGTTAVHNVTYGWEVSESAEYADREKNYYDYYGASDHYTHPTSSTGSAYDFSTGYLPYVNTPYNYNGNAQYHELRVNVQEIKLIQGCGQYNDPYIITDGGMLVTAARIISGQVDDGIIVTLPSDLGATGNIMWHDSTGETDREYTYNEADGKFYAGTNNAYEYTKEQVRVYLAGAYYQIGNSTVHTIELPNGYIGLGAVVYDSSGNTWTETNYECAYAFRGVIVGDPSITTTIINHSANPLVKSANGCVVKDLTVSVKTSVTITFAYNKLFSYAGSGCASYGAVMGQVMGGDNIIDKVAIDFTDSTFSAGSGTYKHLMPVGGYAGVVVNGGLIFRNMDSVPAANRALSSSQCSFVSNSAWLYVNPVIGRVISGYAFNEADAYAASSTTLNNGTKNYGICDLDPDGTVLTVTASAADSHLITASDAQAFYVLSCIVNSGAGSATYSTSNTENAYASIANTPWIAYRSYASTRCAKYDEVGASATVAGDYADVAAKDIYSGSTKIPYIIREYTSVSNVTVNGTTKEIYRARSICGSSTVASITLANTTYALANGYRGINSIYTDSTACRIQFNSLIGNNAVFNLNMSYREYDYDGNGSTTRNNENYNEIENPGFGLFNIMHEVCNSSSDAIEDITISGSVSHEAIKTAGAQIAGKIKDKGVDGVASNRVINVGGLAGYTAEAFNLNNVNLDGLSVTSMKYGGGLVGYAYNADFTITNTTTGSNGVKASSKVKAGGMIGYVSGGNAKVNITQTDNSKSFVIDEIKTTFVSSTKTDYYYSTGSTYQWYFQYYSTGGLIGTIECGNPTANITKVTISDVIIRGKTNSTHNVYTSASILNHRDVAGGVLGSALSTDYSISNVQVIGLDIYGGAAGGIVGYDAFNNDNSGPKHTITDSRVTGTSNTSISAIRSAGGIIGKVYRAKAKSQSKIEISGNIVESATIFSSWSAYSGYAFEDDCSAGTVIGSVHLDTGYSNNGLCEINILNHKSENCTVYTLFTTANASTENENCRESGTGGLIGTIGNVANKTYSIKLYGHNILLKNVSVKNYNKTKTDGNLVANAKTTGFVCGNNYNASQIKIVGFSFQSSDPTNTSNISYISGKMAATAGENYLGSGGYVIMADYKGDSASNTPNTANPTLVDPTDSSDLTAAPESPYVTVNTSGNIGTSAMFLTSDGIAATVADLPVQEIADGDARYGVVPASDKALFASNGSYISKLSVYTTEQNTALTNDFAVLVVDDISKANTTEMINAYINLLAGTDYALTANKKEGYAKDLANVYSVQIYKLAINNSGNFEIVTDPSTHLPAEANLKRDSDQFYMDIDSVDTAGQMFSLIDVRFYDPADNTKIAYHLYIPVIVKKMLTFDFAVATLSGTSYKRSDYEGIIVQSATGDYVECSADDRYEEKMIIDNVIKYFRSYDANEDAGKDRYSILMPSRFSEPTMENLGMPVTIYFMYSYLRSQGEWTTAVNNGENLLRNYDKSLTLSKSTEIPNLPNDTLLVLVDPNNGGKPYYATFGSVFTASGNSGGTLNLSYHPANSATPASNFNTNLDGTGTSFAPVYLNDMLTITAAVDNTDGKMVVESDPAHATVKATLNGRVTYFRPATETELTSQGTDKYALTVTNTENDEGFVPMEEKYYISFFTDTNNSNIIYHYAISTAASFNDNSNPSRIRSVQELQNGVGTAHVVLGNIFVQRNYIVTSTTPDAAPMSSDNNTLTINMSADVWVSDDVISDVSGYLSENSGINVYQSFITNLTRYENDGSSRKVIAGSPQITVNNYAVSARDTTTVNNRPTNSTANNVNAGTNNIEIQTAENINKYLVFGNGSGAHITAQLVLKYDSEESISAQFPNREGDDVDVGTKVSGSSNIAFSLDRTAYSKSTTGVHNDTANHSYYCNIDTERASLSYNVRSTEFEGDYGPLGINPLDSNGLGNTRHVSTLAVYDITNILDKTEDYDTIKCTMTLYCKTDDYSAELQFSDYMVDSGIKLYGQSKDSSSTYTEYVFYLDKSAVAGTSQSDYNLAANRFAIPIEFDVITDGAFESANHYYSNYKVYLEVELVKTEEGVEKSLNPSKAHNYIIYTNARIIPDFID